MVSSTYHFPINEVFKYCWNGADDDLEATVAYADEKGAGEDNTDGGTDDDDDDDDDDDGGGKQKSQSGM